MVRTYKIKNRLERRSHLDENQLLCILGGYLMGVPIKLILDYADTTEATYYSKIKKMQTRFLEDDEAWFSTINPDETNRAWTRQAATTIANSNADYSINLHQCFFDCPHALELSTEAAYKYAEAKKVRVIQNISLTILHTHMVDLVFFRDDRYCVTCKNPFKNFMSFKLVQHLIFTSRQLAVANNIAATRLSKKRLIHHFPVLLLRSIADNIAINQYSDGREYTPGTASWFDFIESTPEVAITRQNILTNYMLMNFAAYLVRKPL